MTNSKRTTPIISVGRDFTVGDVPGQLAIGENIRQYQDCTFVDCTFVLPDSTTIQGKKWSYTQGIRPAIDPKNIFGRQRELAEIDELLKNNSVLALTGFRGTGKSTLASMYVDILEERGECAGIYWRKMDETTEFKDIVESFFEVIGKPIENLGQYKIQDQLTLLFRELNVAPYFLVFDNFEILIDPQTNKPTKPGFSELIEKAKEITSESRVLFTCWECPVSERGIRPTRYRIGGLDIQAGIALLKRRGLTESHKELEKAVIRSGGHPLALILLAQLVKSGDETLSEALTDDSLWIGERGEVAKHILDKIYIKRLSEEERKLLQYVSPFRMPVPLEGIVVVADDPSWKESVAKNIAFSLKLDSLLNETAKNYWMESLIQNYAYNKLIDKIYRHKLISKYYLKLPLPKEITRKEDIQPLIEAHYHSYMAKEYDSAYETIFNNRLDHYLSNWGEYRTLLDLFSSLLPADFKGKKLLSQISNHGNTLGSLGQVYFNLGDFINTIKCTLEALKIAQDIGEKQREGMWLGNIGNAYFNLGDLRKAIEFTGRALQIAKQISDQKNKGRWFGNLGNIYRVWGDLGKSIDYTREAMQIAKQLDDKPSLCISLGNMGIVHSDLGYWRKAIKYFEDAHKMAKQIGNKQSEGLWLGNLGETYRRLGDRNKALENFDEALRIAKEIGDIQREGVWLGNIGVIYDQLGDRNNAIKYYDKALNIAKEIGNKEMEGLWLGNLGVAYSDLGETGKAIGYYDEALRIANEIEDKQRKCWWLGHLGDTYDMLNKVSKAKEYYDEALRIATEIKDKQSEERIFKKLRVLKNKRNN